MQKTDAVYEGDCLELMKSIDSGTVDMVFTDLPYGTTNNSWDSPLDLEALWKSWWRVLKPNGVVVLTAHGRFVGDLIVSQPKAYKLKWVWEKSKATNFQNVKHQPMRKHEDVLVFYKKKPTYNPQIWYSHPYDRGVATNRESGCYGNFNNVHMKSDGERWPVDIVKFNTAECEGKVWHPTQKPVELGRYFIRTYTNEGDTILDCCCGSGSFLVAAKLENRHWIGIELNEPTNDPRRQDLDFIQIANQRLSDAACGQK